MPKARCYNGCYNLSGDLEAAVHKGINLEDPEAMAAFYEVSLEDYLAGQEWASEGLGIGADDSRY